MAKQDAFDDLKNYSKNFGHLLQGLKQQDDKPEEEYSERECVFQKDKLKLFHYLKADKKCSTKTDELKTPVLIVYALVNRPAILDLQHGHSTIAQMIESGLDIYLIDWGYPDELDKHLDLNYYINEQLHACVEQVCAESSVEQINLMGVCQGGVFSLCYSSFHPERVKNLVTVVTPVDFQTQEDVLSNLVRHVDIDQMVNTMGNIPGDMLSNTFLSLRPYYLQVKKYLNLVEETDQLDEKNKERIAHFIMMERWIFDSPDQAGEAFREFVTACYQQNLLIKNEFHIADQRVDLASLQMPVLNIYAEQDHLVPPDSSKALAEIIPKNNYNEVQVKGGHIGIFVSPKSLKTIFPKIADWLKMNP